MRRVFSPSLYLPLLVGLVTLLAWSASASLSSVFPSPVGTVTSVVSGFVDGNLAERTLQTLQSFVVGYCAALVTGFLAGAAIGSSKYLRDSVEPIVSVVYAVPKILLFPIFLVLFGIGPASAIALAFVSGVFPVLFYTMDGVQAMPKIYSRLSRSIGASLRQYLWKIVLPAIMPGFLVGARISFAVTLINIAVAELFGGTRGLGAALRDAYAFGRLEEMMGIGLLLLFVGILGSALLNRLGQLFGWERKGAPEVVGGL